MIGLFIGLLSAVFLDVVILVFSACITYTWCLELFSNLGLDVGGWVNGNIRSFLPLTPTILSIVISAIFVYACRWHIYCTYDHYIIMGVVYFGGILLITSVIIIAGIYFVRRLVEQM